MADPLRTPPSLRVLEPEQAYDGEFFYRLAVDPLVLRDIGIALDTPSYRQQRIVYPLLAAGVSLGQQAWVPWGLVVVNVLGLGVLGALAGRYALDLGRPAWWGVALPLYVGFTFTLARDLSEIVQACAIVATVLALHRQQRTWAAIWMALAVLTRETAVVLAVVLLLTAGCDWLTLSRHRLTAAGWAGLAGLCCYVAVQVLLWLRWGVAPTLAGSANLAVPFSGPLQYLSTVGSLGWIEVAWFGGLVAVALLTRGAPVHLRLGMVAYVLLVLSLSVMVWAGDAAWLRAATEASVLGWLVLFHGGQWRMLGSLVASGALWPAVARWAIAT
jgi:hypothetical protein